MKKGSEGRKKQACLSVDLGVKLLGEVESMRRAIQDAIGPDRAVSRGDVVRLALRRLQLAILQHDAETAAGTTQQDAITLWMGVAQDIQLDGNCPSWLVPGAGPFLETPKSKKGARK